MIVMNVTYKCKPGMRERFLEAIKAEGLDEACRAEAGNSKYAYFFAADDPDEMLLVENWRDQEALDAHGKEPHFRRLGEMKDGFVEETIIERFTK